jgi:hypothetical protein
MKNELNDFQKSLEDAHRKTLDIKTQDDQPSDPPELSPIKDKFAREQAKILAPVFYKFIENKIDRAVADINQTGIVTIERIQTVVASAVSSGGGGGDVSASYIVVGNTSSLANERALTAGTNITFTDGGPGGTFTINSSGGTTTLTSKSVGYGTVGNNLTGNGNFQFDDNTNRLILSSSVRGSGSLYLGVPPTYDMNSTAFGADKIGIVMAHGGSIGAALYASNFVANLLAFGWRNGDPASGISSELTLGDYNIGILRIINSDSTMEFNSDLITLTCNEFHVNSTLTATNIVSQFTGSLTTLDGINPTFVAGPNITINTQSNGSVAISGARGSIFTVSNPYAATTSSLAIGTLTQNSSRGSDVFFYVSGASGSVGSSVRGASIFGGDVLASGVVYGTNSIIAIPGGAAIGGASSSLASNLVAFGTQYQTIIASRNKADSGWMSYMLYADQGSKFNNLYIGDFLGAAFGSGAQNKSILFYTSASSAPFVRFDAVTGSFISGSTIFVGGMSGSHQSLSDGTPAFVAGPNLTITTQSNGAVALSGTVDFRTITMSGLAALTASLTTANTGTIAHITDDGYQSGSLNIWNGNRFRRFRILNEIVAGSDSWANHFWTGSLGVGWAGATAGGQNSIITGSQIRLQISASTIANGANNASFTFQLGEFADNFEFIARLVSTSGSVPGAGGSNWVTGISAGNAAGAGGYIDILATNQMAWGVFGGIGGIATGNASGTFANSTWFRILYSNGKMSVWYVQQAAMPTPSQWNLGNRDVVTYANGSTGHPPTYINIYMETYATSTTVTQAIWDSATIREW